MSSLLFVCACFLGNLTTANAGMISLSESVSADLDPLAQLKVQSCIETWLQKFRMTELVWADNVANVWNVASTTAAPANVESPASKITAVDGAEPNPIADWSSPFDPRSLEASLIGTHCLSSGDCGCSGTSVANSPGGCPGIVLIVSSQTLDLPSLNFLGRLGQENFLHIPSGIALEMLRPPQILTVFA